ncbi:MAG TPA: HEAT repeat domain-containing protein [Polyangiaceae bacterium]|nr:HEAT repeat domain-containing protein [Polyangiaceae bacterium]
MARPPLERAVRDPGFTPSVRDVGALVDLLGNDDLAKDAERAIARVGVPSLAILRDRFASATGPLRARILRVIGRFAEDPSARTVLLAALDDADPKTRRNAVIALGHTRAEGIEDALLGVWERDARGEMRRSVAASLGKVGTGKSLALLQEASRAEDGELSRIGQRSMMMIERTESRHQRGRIDPESAPGGPVAVEVLARRGLEEMLAEELALVPAVTDVGVAGPGSVRAQLTGPMSALFAARTMLSFRFPLPTEWREEGEELLEEAIARVVAGVHAERIFSTWTVGAVRYRIAWGEGGHKRAASWQTAGAVARRAPAIINDPTASLWELLVTTGPRLVEVALVPRALADPRFAWRRRDVPAASHPTIAAALARVAGVRADDVVWDPFVGSGGELVERALSGPYASLAGSDIDASALSAARENLDAAGFPARLDQSDALAHAPRGVTLILTNPPMGRRASRSPELADTLDRFVAHASSVLVPGGRLVWVSPSPKRTRAAAARAGLLLDWARIVDMGGFDAEMQRWIR